MLMRSEHFKNQDAAPVYRRFREQGRMMPDGLKYVDSWTGRPIWPLLSTDGV